MAAYRFVHAADIHLDSPLRSLALRDPDLADLIGTATRRAFVRIVDLCLHEEVDALLLAGDLYDGDQTSMKTARFLAAEVGRLHGAGIKVFVIRGNHDALSRITKELILPDSVKLFGGRAEAVEVLRARGEVPIRIHGLSFAQPQAPESLLRKYKPPVEDAVNIGLMHTSLDGSAGHDPYAPCGLVDLQANGFRYWALGHIHKRNVVEGPCTVVMPGMPQGRDINEGGAKSVCLVTVGDDRSIRVEERITSLAEFAHVPVDVTGAEAWSDLVGKVSSELEQAREKVGSDHLVARLTLTGVTPLAWKARRDIDLLGAEMEARAARIGGCWVETIEIACRAAAPAAGSPSDPLAELRRLIEADIIGSEGYRQKLVGIADEILAQMPQDCRDMLGADETAFDDALTTLAREGAEDVLARLHALPAGDES